MDCRLVVLIPVAALACIAAVEAQQSTRTEAAAYGDTRADRPGLRRRITPSDLPAPYASRSSRNSPRIVAPPADARLSIPDGFAVAPFARDLRDPRQMRVAPNGDVFVAESEAGRIRVLRPNQNHDGVAEAQVFASGLNYPFGIAFHPAEDPEWVYVANTSSVVRFPYRTGDLKARAAAQSVVAGLPTGGHVTRDVVFSKDGTRMFVSVGSLGNAGETMRRLDAAAVQKWQDGRAPGAAWGPETERANVLVFDPDGKNRRVFAAGLRNCVGMAIEPTSGDLWCSTNERDGLGDDLPPDYVTRVREGAFYGWPWYYIGANEDPHLKGARPDLRDKITVPDVLLQPHSASLGMTFYTGTRFPADYHGNAFAAQHGSWNRSRPTGYKIIRIIVKDGVPTGEYEDFVTGFALGERAVWGRPVGVATAKDGSLLFSEDGNGTIWRVTATDATER